MTEAPRHILIVEDNQGDVFLAKEAFREAGQQPLIEAVQDGEQAMLFLRRQGAYCAARRPELIILDLNLPRMGGREVLAQITVDNELAKIPVVILTSSTGDRDIVDKYCLPPESYFVKPPSFTDYVRTVQLILDYWRLQHSL